MDGTFYGRTTQQAADQEEMLASRRKSRLRIAVILVSIVAFVAIVAVVALAVKNGKGHSGGPESTNGSGSLPSSIKAYCSATRYPDLCYSTISEVDNGTTDPVKIYHFALQIAYKAVLKAEDELTSYNTTLNGNYTNAINACDYLLEMAKGSINDSMAETDLTVHGVIDDLRTWLSASMTYQETCLDGFPDGSPIKNHISSITFNSTALTSNALAILTQLSKFFSSIGLRRRLLEVSSYEMVDGFPSWLSVKDRELIDSPGLRASASIVVAADGTGTHRTIAAGLAAVPEKSLTRTIVYVKSGVYREKVRVEKTMWNVLMIGDGAALTIVTGNDNVADGSTTFLSATFSSFGQGFIAMEMAFQNTAGLLKSQAVAFLSDSDKSVYYKCKFDGYQDTLYTHSMRQFYRECDILGTVDFIFGNAAVVLQNCNIMPRFRSPGQSDTLTAQGKSDENMNTGTSFHLCTVTPAGNLSGMKVYLGRPWRDYSTVVWMKTYLPAIIHPTGWMPWITGVTPKSTIFYGEYANTGPGSSTVGRVTWAGVHPALTVLEATRFTVGSFIDGGTWIPATGVNFTLGL